MFTTRQNIKLSFAKPSFTVNTAKRTVTCVLRYTINIPEMFSVANSGRSKKPASGISVGQCFVENSAVGIAICCPDDKFCPKIGKEIAEARAESQAYKDASKHMADVYSAIAEKFSDYSLEFATRGARIVEHNDAYIKSISNTDE